MRARSYTRPNHANSSDSLLLRIYFSFRPIDSPLSLEFPLPSLNSQLVTRHSPLKMGQATATAARVQTRGCYAKPVKTGCAGGPASGDVFQRVSYDSRRIDPPVKATNVCAMLFPAANKPGQAPADPNS